MTLSLDRGWAHKVRGRTTAETPALFGSHADERHQHLGASRNVEWEACVLRAVEGRVRPPVGRLEAMTQNASPCFVLL